jgi:hypothetical protein
LVLSNSPRPPAGGGAAACGAHSTNAYVCVEADPLSLARSYAEADDISMTSIPSS